MSTQTSNFDVLALIGADRTRLLRGDETVPSRFECGFELLGELDREWIWVLESGGEIKGVIVASPCHGAAFIWRIAIDQDVAYWSAGKLLRRFLLDIRRRGLRGYLTIVNCSSPVQKQLADIIGRAGGQAYGDFTLMVGKTPEGLI